jgi:hypothetical protein
MLPEARQHPIRAQDDSRSARRDPTGVMDTTLSQTGMISESQVRFTGPTDMPNVPNIQTGTPALADPQRITAQGSARERNPMCGYQGVDTQQPPQKKTTDQKKHDKQIKDKAKAQRKEAMMPNRQTKLLHKEPGKEWAASAHQAQPGCVVRRMENRYMGRHHRRRSALEVRPADLVPCVRLQDQAVSYRARHLTEEKTKQGHSS